MKLTEHFSLAEFTRSATATAAGIDNTPTDTAIVNMLCLSQNVLEPLREWYGRPITISSGYRSPKLNAAVGGVSSSQHMTGEAVDIIPPTSPPGSSRRYTADERNAELRKMYDYIREHLPHDQLILEHKRPRSKADTTLIYWIHVSSKRDISKNRHQNIILTV